jgi:hypothetical protein
MASSPLRTRSVSHPSALCAAHTHWRPAQSSSFVGPLLVGLISDTTGDIRYAFFFLVIMVWAAVPILASVDIQRGREDARIYSKRGRT